MILIKSCGGVFYSLRSSFVGNFPGQAFLFTLPVKTDVYWAEKRIEKSGDPG
jgi:hypothetical protein